MLTVFLLANKTPATADTKHFVAQLSLSVSLQYLYELIKVGADFFFKEQKRLFTL